MVFLLRKIALPYPHKCLFGFVEQKRIDRQEFFKEYSCHKRWPLCLRMSAHAPYSLSTGNCREIFIIFLVDMGATRIFFYYRPFTDEDLWSFEACKRAPTCIYPLFDWYYHYSASLVLKRVRIRCARRCCCKVFSGRRVYLRLYSPIIRLELPPCRWKGMQRGAPVVFSGKLLYCPFIDGITWVLAYARKQRRKNAVVLATEVVDSLLWVERHSGTVTGLPPKERLQKHIHWSL